MKTTYKYNLHRRKLLIEALIDGKTNIDLILDTGAGTTVISEVMASVLGYDIKNLPKTENFVSASGRVNARMIYLNRIELLGKKVENFKVAVMNLPVQIMADGLVGMDFLQTLKKISIDFEQQLIEVE